MRQEDETTPTFPVTVTPLSAPKENTTPDPIKALNNGLLGTISDRNGLTDVKQLSRTTEQFESVGKEIPDLGKSHNFQERPVQDNRSDKFSVSQKTLPKFFPSDFDLRMTKPLVLSRGEHYENSTPNLPDDTLKSGMKKITKDLDKTRLETIDSTINRIPGTRGLFQRFKASNQSLRRDNVAQIQIVPVDTPAIVMRFESFSPQSSEKVALSKMRHRRGKSAVSTCIKVKLFSDVDRSSTLLNKNSYLLAMGEISPRRKISDRLRLSLSTNPPAQNSLPVEVSVPAPTEATSRAVPVRLCIRSVGRKPTGTASPCCGDLDDNPSIREPGTKVNQPDLRRFQVLEQTSHSGYPGRVKMTVTGTSIESDGSFLNRKTMKLENHMGRASFLKGKMQELNSPDKHRSGPIFAWSGLSKKSLKDEHEFGGAKTFHKPEGAVFRAVEQRRGAANSLISNDLD